MEEIWRRVVIVRGNLFSPNCVATLQRRSCRIEVSKRELKLLTVGFV